MKNVNNSLVSGFYANSNYNRMLPLWNFSHDCYYGASEIKSETKREIYLPMRPIEIDEWRKKQNKSRYLTRLEDAAYENVYRPVIDDITGIMQKNEANVRFGETVDSESPDVVQRIQWYGNSDDDTLAGLKSRLNKNQVLYGRYGLLLEVAADDMGLNPEFYIAEYNAYSILNGGYVKKRSKTRKQLKWVLLDESSVIFDWNKKTEVDDYRYRLLALDADGKYYQKIFEGDSAFDGFKNFNIDVPTGEIRPAFEGKTLDFIPFTVCNYDRLGFDVWEQPPFLDVAKIAIDVYRSDSLCKTALWQCATPTLVISNAANEDDDIQTGGVLYLRSGDSGTPVDAKIIETSGAGLSEMDKRKKSGIESLRYTSIRDLLNGAGANSSAEAMKLRVSPGTSIIEAVDKTGARAIEEQLCFAYIWATTADEKARKEAAKKISYMPDVEYFPNEIQLQMAVQLLEANQNTRTFSNESMYRLFEKILPNTLPTFEDNNEQIKTQEELAPPQQNKETALNKNQNSDQKPIDKTASA